MRRNISSRGRWEGTFGYSRAVVAGPWVLVAGTTATVDGEVVAVGDAYAQTRVAFDIALAALGEAGLGLHDVVRTRMYVTDIAFQDDVGRAHHEFFAKVRPAATIVGVQALAHRNHLVEVELDAYRDAP